MNATQDFFTDTVNGANQPLDCPYGFTHTGNFDRHIFASIPNYFQLMETLVRQIATKNYIRVLDIGASEGSFIKEICLCNPTIKATGLDCNVDMAMAFAANPVRNCNYVVSDFWDYKPSTKFDIVIESMTFQFMDGNRFEQFKKVSMDLLKSNGLFISNEKLMNENIWAHNEILKDHWKAQYFPQAEIQRKAKEVLPTMNNSIVTVDAFKRDASEHWINVVNTWQSYNFYSFQMFDK